MMLKKIVDYIVILLLTVATTGFTVSRHYCGHHLVEVALFQVVKCSCGDQDCHTDVRQIKVNDDFSVSEVLHPHAPLALDLFCQLPAEIPRGVCPVSLASVVLMEAPPPPTSNPMAVLQSFRC